MKSPLFGWPQAWGSSRKRRARAPKHLYNELPIDEWLHTKFWYKAENGYSFIIVWIYLTFVQGHCETKQLTFLSHYSLQNRNKIRKSEKEELFIALKGAHICLSRTVYFIQLTCLVLMLCCFEKGRCQTLPSPACRTAGFQRRAGFRRVWHLHFFKMT